MFTGLPADREVLPPPFGAVSAPSSLPISCHTAEHPTIPEGKLRPAVEEKTGARFVASRDAGVLGFFENSLE